MGQSLRKHERFACNRGGRILSLDGRHIVECLVQDICAGGARLYLAEPLVIRGHFRLDYGVEEIRPRCEVRWRRGNVLGVKFLLDEPASETTAQMLQRAQRKPLRYDYYFDEG